MALNAKNAASSKLGGAASAALSVAGDVGGALIGQAFARRNMKLQEQTNKRIAKFNQQLEYENQRNAGLLQMQGLKNAGLNVGAMLGQAPQVATAPADGSSLPQSPSLEGLGKNSIAAFQAQQLNEASIRLAEANADKAEAEAEGTKIDNSTRDEKNKLNLDNMRKDLSVKEQQIVQSKATVENMQKTFEVFEKNSAKQRWLMDYEGYYKYQMGEKLAKDVLWYDKRATRELAKLASSAQLDSWQANVCMVSFLSQYVDYELKERGVKVLKEHEFINKDEDGNITFKMNAYDYKAFAPTYKAWLEQALIESGLPPAAAKSEVEKREWVQWLKLFAPPVMQGIKAGASFVGPFH